MGKGKTPPAPDYAAAAVAQGEANKESAIATAKLSNPNEITPYGEKKVTYGEGGGFNQAGYDSAQQEYFTNLANYDENRVTQEANPGYQVRGQTVGATPAIYAKAPTAPNRSDYETKGDELIPTVRTTLSPENQSLYEQELRIGAGLGDIGEKGVATVDKMLGTPFDMSQVPDRAVAGEEGYGRALAAIMDREQPFIDRNRDRMDAKLRTQGIMPGMEAYQEQMRDLERGENDFRLGAQDRAMGQQSVQFGLDEKARQNEITQQSYLRQLPLNELNAIRSGVQIQNPQFQAYQGASVAPPPLFNASQLQYQSALDKTNAQNASTGGTTSGIMGMLGTGLMAGGMAF